MDQKLVNPGGQERPKKRPHVSDATHDGPSYRRVAEETKGVPVCAECKKRGEYE